MSKTNGAKRPVVKADLNGLDRLFASRAFSADLDGIDFEKFHQFRRAFVELNASGALQPDPTADSGFPTRSEASNDATREIDAVVRDWFSRAEREKKEALKSRSKMIKTILHEFDRLPINGPDDFSGEKSLKRDLRNVLFGFLTSPSNGITFHKNSVFVPTGYQISGELVGPVQPLKPKKDVMRLVAEALFSNARKALGLLWTVASQGDDLYLLRLAQSVVPFAKVLNERLSENPQALGAWPMGLAFWPVLKSPHPGFDCDHQQFLEALRIGEDFPFTIGAEARWTARDPIGKWALHLCQEIEIMQDGHYVNEESAPWEHKLEKLAPFSGETWEDWWEVAKGLLLHDYIDVVDIPELNKTVRAKNDRKSRGRIRKRIMQALKDKFKSMAWGNKIR